MSVRRTIDYYVSRKTANVHRRVTSDLGGTRVVTSDVPIAADVKTFRIAHPNANLSGSQKKEKTLEDMLEDASPDEIEALRSRFGGPTQDDSPVEVDDPLSDLSNREALEAYLEGVGDVEEVRGLIEDEEAGKYRVSWIETMEDRVEQLTED